MNRLYGVLNNRLYKHKYLAGDQYTIADMICYPWTINWKFQGQDIEEFKHFKRWFEELGARPAVQKGMAVGADLSVDDTKLPPEEQARIRKMLYNQRARPVAGVVMLSFLPGVAGEVAASYAVGGSRAQSRLPMTSVADKRARHAFDQIGP